MRLQWMEIWSALWKANLYFINNHDLFMYFVIRQRLSHLGIIWNNYYQSGHVANTIILLLSLPSHYNHLLTFLPDLYIAALYHAASLWECLEMMQCRTLEHLSNANWTFIISLNCSTWAWMNFRNSQSSLQRLRYDLYGKSESLCLKLGQLELCKRTELSRASKWEFHSKKLGPQIKLSLLHTLKFFCQR